MAWETEAEKFAIWEKYHEKIFKPRGTSAPDFSDREPLDHYRKRMMNKAAPFVAADLQEVKTEHLYGSALDHYENEYFKSAAAEAVRPTNIPEGTLKEVVHYDAAGRPSYTYHGSPSVWMSTFTRPKKRLAGIYTSGLNFQKV